MKDNKNAVYSFPVQIGDTVKCLVKDENNVVDLISYKVCGLAVILNTQYVITEDGMLNEINTVDCILPE